MPITIADVAARAGVSKTTVSRVLNHKDDLDAQTAAHVRQVIEELGYVPSARGVGLARGRTRIIGMLVPSVTWPWIGEVLQGVIDVVETEGYGMLLFTCNDGEASIRRFASQVSARAFDGLLVIEPEGTLEFITGLHHDGLPVVLIDDRGHQPLFPSVATTNHMGAGTAASHLLALGRRSPLVITGKPELGCVQERLEGFCDVYAAAGLPVGDGHVVDGDFRFEQGQEVVRRLLAEGLKFDSIFAHNDLSAAGALRAVCEAGLRVPEDVAIIGFDDIPLAEQTDPPLTTVHQPLRELGETATRMLLSRLSGQHLPDEPNVIPTRLVVRGSTA